MMIAALMDVLLDLRTGAGLRRCARPPESVRVSARDDRQLTALPS